MLSEATEQHSRSLHWIGMKVRKYRFALLPRSEGPLFLLLIHLVVPRTMVPPGSFNGGKEMVHAEYEEIW
jgi:hypothetical protein